MTVFPTNNITNSPSGITVIIVTYNAAAYLQNCLNSIYAQQYPAIDIVVIDGKSIDGTAEILQQNADKLYYWISENDKGIYDAMNKALPHIAGQWVYFLGADDELLPAFSDMVSGLTDTKAIYYGNVLANGVKRSGQVSDYYMAKGGIYHQAIIYPRSVFEHYTYNTKYKIAADYAFNMRLFKDKQYRFVYVDMIIAKYNHTGISSQVVDEAFEKDKTKLILSNFGFKIGSRYLFRLIKGMFHKQK